jgi:hypothetical protein
VVSFQLFSLPSGEQAWIPSDLRLDVPRDAAVPADDLHRLVYIPWDARYLDRVVGLIDAEYVSFFRYVLPYLRVRTADVHVATCLPFAGELLPDCPGPADARVVHIAFILHDSGWSQMSDAEIAASVGVTGLALSGSALGPKSRHAEAGRDLAARLLREYEFDPPLTADQTETIYQAILLHDRPEEVAALGRDGTSIRLVCDTDHLWSFTHENFWQDTVRKGVAPPDYLINLQKDLDGYLVTDPGKKKAGQMLRERRAEVELWREWTEDRPAGERRR